MARINKRAVKLNTLVQTLSNVLGVMTGYHVMSIDYTDNKDVTAFTFNVYQLDGKYACELVVNMADNSIDYVIGRLSSYVVSREFLDRVNMMANDPQVYSMGIVI